MTIHCDNKSVGLILENPQGDTGIIFRCNYPQTYALIAGHQDGLSPEEAIVKKAKGEAGIELTQFRPLFEGRIDNPCGRPGGNHHYWTVFYAYEYIGEAGTGVDSQGFRWLKRETVLELAKTTDAFAKKYGFREGEVGDLTNAIFGDVFTAETDPEWLKKPGLEPVWREILRKIGII